MDTKEMKCVMVIDEELPAGIIANTAGIMGITLGKYMPQVVGSTVTDADGNSHLGVIQFPVPILKGNKDILKEIRTKLYDDQFKDVITVDFSDVAQSCKNYDEYIEKAAHAEKDDIEYFGIAICGSKKKVNKLTGSMPLLR